MSDFRARLSQEHSELRTKIKKLQEFILGDNFESLAEVDRDDLREQLKHMEQYCTVLTRRVGRLCNNA